MAYRLFIGFTCLLAFVVIVLGAYTSLVKSVTANVLLLLPLGVVTAHNGAAALLLISLVYLNFRLWRQQH